ncbi:GcrA family cell cycle regulator [Bradyrhizobium sp. 41S5]|uniref:GcrA family cell cycle regulator n=1 Tax=Bradyrhizobium sp. 41S5 TaxID=1404443 RepID=UPI00156B6FE4|nr:GcrA family cell cycle regulator [Bradyrhizobium sp. 41S5]UFX42122.1 GcrA family cell cycle regulator [Bradyrhizobium sp. 41S5]
MTVPPTWSEDRVERLKNLWASGMSCSQIAAELGNVTRNAVIGKVHRLGLPGRADDRRAKAIEAKRAPRLGSPMPKRTKVLRAVLSNPSSAEAKQPVDDPTAGYASAFDASVAVERRKGLLDLRDGDCKWPIGDPTTPDFFFCGDPAVSELPYCGPHCRAAYQSAGQRETRITPEERARRVALGQRMAAMNRAKRAAAS